MTDMLKPFSNGRMTSIDDALKDLERYFLEQKSMKNKEANLKDESELVNRENEFKRSTSEKNASEKYEDFSIKKFPHVFDIFPVHYKGNVLVSVEMFDRLGLQNFCSQSEWKNYLGENLPNAPIFFAVMKSLYLNRKNKEFKKEIYELKDDLGYRLKRFGLKNNQRIITSSYVKEVGSNFTLYHGDEDIELPKFREKSFLIGSRIGDRNSNETRVCNLFFGEKNAEIVREVYKWFTGRFPVLYVPSYIYEREVLCLEDNTVQFREYHEKGLAVEMKVYDKKDEQIK